MPSGDDLASFSPDLALVGTLVLLLLAPLVAGRGSRTSAGIVTLGVLITIILTINVGRQVASAGQTGFAPAQAGALLIADNFSVFFKLFLLTFLLGVTWLWWMNSAEEERNAPEFFVLLVGSALGMMLMVSSLNLLVLAVAIELASLPSYVLAGFNKHSRMSAEASLKYVLFGAVSASVMIFGISLLYGLYGSLDLIVVSHRMIESLSAGTAQMALGIALICIMVGIGFKISAVPFHFWCPDVFQGAKTEVTTWLSVASKGAGLGLLLRLVYSIGVAAGGQTHVLLPISLVIGCLGALTCTVGNLAAYRQNSVKRLLAYSSIAHAGYMMMAAAIFAYPQSGVSSSAMSAVLAYLIIYLFMNLGAFGVTVMVERARGDDSIDSFTGLGRSAPMLGLPMLFCLVSLTGLPPFGGFIAKWWLIWALGGAGGWMWFLAIVTVVNTLISLFYYLRIVKQMYFADVERPEFSAPLSGLALVNICGLVLLLTGFLLINPVKRASDRYATDLFGTMAAGTEPDKQPPGVTGRATESTHDFAANR